MSSSMFTWGLTAVLTALAVGATWWIGSAWPRVRAQRWGRWILCAEVLLLVAPGSAWFVSDGVSEGDFLCERCGTIEHMVTWYSWPAGIRARMAEHSSVADARVYVSTFPLADSAAHVHEWRPIGCHETGGLFTRWIACSMRWDMQWYRDLPHVSDRALATATALRLASAPENDVTSALRTFPEPARDDETSDDRFQAWRTAWRATHPDWP